MKTLSGFEVIKKDRKTGARLGILTTPHGVIHTPSYVMVATHARIKALEPLDIPKTKTQVVIANTYHLWDKALANKREKHLAHKLLGVPMPMMTDSGGFQVFSFGAAKEHHVGKVLTRGLRKPGEKSAIRITEKGVYFMLDGEKRFLSPEDSIAIQEKIGADIIFAFDECTSPLHPFTYNKQAMERTHRWAKRCIKARTRPDQMLFGIVQGGSFKRLRTASARAIGSLPFDGFGIGGSFGEDQMTASLATVVPHLPEDKPRHLLGIGRIKDIFIAVENGMDLFDCVIPTREARHARLWTKNGPVDLRKGIFKKSTVPIERGCGCPACRGKEKTTRARLHALFKGKEPGVAVETQRAKAARLATMHNVWFFNTLLERIRDAIRRGRFKEFQTAYLSKVKS